jgi:hypothetical protein
MDAAGRRHPITRWHPVHNSLPRRPEFQQVDVVGRLRFSFNTFNPKWRSSQWTGQEDHLYILGGKHSGAAHTRTGKVPDVRADSGYLRSGAPVRHPASGHVRLPDRRFHGYRRELGAETASCKRALSVNGPFPAQVPVSPAGIARALTRVSSRGQAGEAVINLRVCGDGGQKTAGLSHKPRQPCATICRRIAC